MKLFLFTLVMVLSTILFAQPVYNNPGGTISSVCSGTFYDTGGAGGSYTSYQNIVTTFCAPAGQQLMFNFTSINIENGYDFLHIYDGSSTASPYLGYITGGGTATISSTSGCLTFQFISDNIVNSAGWVATISCLTPADYTHPTVGIQNEYVGACLVSNCGPFRYADNGNILGNYSNNVATYRTFCPSIAGNCMRVTFNSFNIESGYDDLMVINGPTQNNTVFSGFPTTLSGYTSPHLYSLTGNLNGSAPFSFQSTDPSGCLTFFFISDGINNGPGWDATLSCVPCAGGPSGTSNSDCLFSTAICSNASITSMANGPGIVAEGCTGANCPAGGENHSNWYRFVAQTSGTLNITITPTVATDDYDFAIYGPNVSCGALGNPIRCSDAGTSGVTGAMPPGTGTSENVLGDGYVSTLNVTAGQSYYLVVDKWSPSGGTGYTLSFSGTASLNCLILPVELTLFEAEYEPNYNMVDLTWVTQTEINMSHYDVERSVDGEFYDVISRVQATGDDNKETQYFAFDTDPFSGVNYYRLKLFDRDGTYRYSEIRAINVLDPSYDVLSLFPNPTTGKTEVIFNSFSKETATFILTDASGRIITNEPIDVVKGGNRLDLDMTNQSEGVYLITIVTKHKTHRVKLIKQ